MENWGKLRCNGRTRSGSPNRQIHFCTGNGTNRIKIIPNTFPERCRGTKKSESMHILIKHINSAKEGLDKAKESAL
jgi:hypothetical protein